MADQKFASGGVIRGSGSKQDDNVPLALWNDCPLIPARDVKRYGERLIRALRQGQQGELGGD